MSTKAILREPFPADQIPTPDYDADPVTAWAADVLLGNIVTGPHVRNQCERHLCDLRDGPARGLFWDNEAALKVINWFERNLFLKDGKFQGKPFLLHPSQKFRVGSLFGWKWKESGFRRFRRFYDEEGKGNGKSPMLGGVGLYMLIADGENSAEVYAAASKKDQAQILFKDAVSMRNQSKRLSTRTTTQGVNPVWQITYVGKKGDKRYFKPIASDDGQSGPRPHCGLCDEVHEHKNRTVIDMLEAGFKFRDQPLIVMATNSGTDRHSICWEEHQYAVDVAAGIKLDDEEMTFVCALDEGDDWENDPSCWVKVNPLLDVTISSDWLAKRVALAKAIPGKRNDIARLNFCEWTHAENAAIRYDVWMKCQKELDLQALIDGEYPCYGGLDLSQTNDFTAFTLTWVLDATKDAEKLVSKTWFWTPKGTVGDRSEKDQAPYDLWVDQGYIEAVEGERLKYAWLASALGELNSRFNPREIAGDQYGIERLSENLTDQGISLPLVVHPQGFQKRILDKDRDAVDGEKEVYLWMPDSINKLEAAIYEERISIDPNPLLNLNVASVRYEPNRTGHRMFDKIKSSGRIDGVVSVAMSVGMALCRERYQAQSPWDDPNFSLVAS